MFYLLIVLLSFGYIQMNFPIDSKASSNITKNLNSGFFEYTIGENTGRLEAFEEGYTDIVINEDQVVVRVKDLNGVSFLITLQGKGIADNLVHTYVAVAPGLKKEDFKATISVVGFEKDDILNPFQWKKGELTILEYNREDGTFNGKFSGEGKRIRDIKNEHPFTFTGNFEMQFSAIYDYRSK